MLQERSTLNRANLTPRLGVPSPAGDQTLDLGRQFLALRIVVKGLSACGPTVAYIVEMDADKNGVSRSGWTSPGGLPTTQTRRAPGSALT